jgi:hypothetical protein
MGEITLKQYIDKCFRWFKDYVDRRFADQQAAVAAALASAEKAVNKSAVEIESWRKASNEWRGAMNDRERNFMPRPEAEAAFKDLSKQISELRTTSDTDTGRDTGISKTFSILLAVGLAGLTLISAIAAVVSIYIALRPHP